MGCHAGTCLLGCLRASSAGKGLRMKESYSKSLLFISIKRVLFHLLTVKTGRIIMLWLLWNWFQWWKESYEAELRDNCLKSWLQGFTLMSSCKALLDRAFLLMSFMWGGGEPQGRGAEWSGRPFLGLRFQVTSWWGHCTAYWSCVSCQPPASPTGWLLRPFPFCPRNDTSLIYWFAIFQMTSYSFFFHSFPLLTFLLLNSHLSHFHFPVLWNGNNTFQLLLCSPH